MMESTYLNGRVVKRTLPLVPLGAGADAPVLKRLLLPQGELAQFYDADDPIRYMAFIELKAGGVRGHHYHNAKDEWIYVVQGEALLRVQDRDSKEKAALRLEAGDLARIRPGIAHALETIKAGQAIEFSEQRFDPLDTHRFTLE